ncbi:MAG: UTP--glucose-1-phosphate uridylyltransferase [Spirochaetia bacterium]
MDDEIKQKMQRNNIDIELTETILKNINEGRYDRFKPVKAAAFPGTDEPEIVDFSKNPSLSLPLEQADGKISHIAPDISVKSIGKIDGDTITFDHSALTALGTLLYPYTSYGVLNGGSATSYADTKKNKSFDEDLFSLYSDIFEKTADISRGRAKGITPAFINPDGSFGPSFLELKMRALLIEAVRYQTLTGKRERSDSLCPMFQMTSVNNNEEIESTYLSYRESPFLAPLIETSGIDVTRTETGVQPLIAAFTHSEKGRPKRIFQDAQGNPLPLPGGHGQNFSVLESVYRKLREQGKRFVYLGNVDNLGFTPDPAGIAYLALTGKQAAFDFTFKTAVDVKGGILVRDDEGNLTCADIGPAVDKAEIQRAVDSGTDILFNAATGLFDLDYLVNHLEEIQENLPVRVTDQDKDKGKYSQAEQVTWEVLGVLDDFLVYGQNKYDRFMAAKMLVETLMTSGIELENPAFPSSENPAEDLKGLAGKLHRGLQKKLRTIYGLKLENGKWIPKTTEEITAEFSLR